MSDKGVEGREGEAAAAERRHAAAAAIAGVLRGFTAREFFEGLREVCRANAGAGGEGAEEFGAASTGVEVSLLMLERLEATLRYGSLAEMRNEAREDNAIGLADEVFWLVIRSQFPEAPAGEDSGRTLSLRRAQELAVYDWIEDRVPGWRSGGGD